MARKKVQADPVLRDWPSVDTALRDIRECVHTLKELEVERDRRMDDVRTAYTEKATPLQNRIKRLEGDVKTFVDAHRAELTGKSRRLNFGSVGYRISSRLVIPNGKAAEILAALKSLGRNECYKVTETLDREALKRQPPDFLESLGMYINQRDEFYYDVQEPEAEG